MKKIALFTSILSVNAFANDVSVTPFYIESIRISESTGITYVNPVGDIQIKNTSCSATDLYSIVNTADSLTYNAAYSALLSAATAKKQVKVWVSTDINDCHNDRQRISIVEVEF